MKHEKFQTVESQINWNAPAYKLYEKAKANGQWNPKDLDFSQDQEDFKNMTEDERLTVLPLVSAFSAGEEAVTIDILPMVYAMASQGRLEDTMFLTTFMHEEAKHTEMFSRWQEAVGISDIDLTSFHNDDYKRLFYEHLPESMERLKTDDSPEAVIRASTVYNMVIEGTLAKSGFNSFRQIFKKAGLLPGILKGIDYLNMDEARHLQFGTFTIQRLVAGNEANFKVFHNYMDELWPHVDGFVDYLMSLYEMQRNQAGENFSLEFDTNALRNYVDNQFNTRKSKIERAREYQSAAEVEAAASKE